jgi:hypothetical protein
MQLRSASRCGAGLKIAMHLDYLDVKVPVIRGAYRKSP